MNQRLPMTPLLGLALGADAAASGATGLLLALGAGALAPSLGLPFGLLLGAGIVCLAWAAFLAATARGGTVTGGRARAVIWLNVLWVADSLLVLLLAPRAGFAPTGLGVAFVLAQAGAVAGLAALQAFALRRTAAGAGRTALA